ncbi:uncharacterized protein EV422DRAFT_276393 [Fimicolochytrium jonesii]|uniref:uncharacterized protein n=1 Tax=Fimicolochytrium jonesii TaxID=1396493 RepID=UPI0022FEF646|nr:uncharacterized protein EV422DRAFT_276393 [Fimicolochytrium jonesii]KAI8816719.1 hypothetical protein EV422DRAFT_276393 [Fimicolochytrium jonesii]
MFQSRRPDLSCVMVAIAHSPICCTFCACVCYQGYHGSLGACQGGLGGQEPFRAQPDIEITSKEAPRERRGKQLEARRARAWCLCKGRDAFSHKQTPTREPALLVFIESVTTSRFLIALVLLPISVLGPLDAVLSVSAFWIIHMSSNVFNLLLKVPESVLPSSANGVTPILIKMERMDRLLPPPLDLQTTLHRPAGQL